MRASANIAVYDENDQLSLLVEVKAVPESSADWAVSVRREIIEEAGFTPRYFLVVARDFTYIWTTQSSETPNQTVATDELFRKYLSDIQSNGQSIAPSSLELMVGIWLTDLAQQSERAVAVDTVRRSGLPSAVANGRVEFLAAA